MISPSSNCSNKDVRKWLEELFQNEEIPTFDETEELMETLRKIMSKNQETEKDAMEIIQIEKKDTEVFKKKTDELRSLLDGEFISLSSDTLEKVENIAALGTKMNLREPTLTNFLLAIIEAENKEMKNKEKEMIDDYHLASLSRKVTRIMKTNDLLRRDLKTLEDTVELQEAYKPKVIANNSFLDKKIEEYKYRIKKYERDLEKRNFDPSLQHHQLLQRASLVQELERNVQNLQSKLNSYRSLPPNESLTRLKVQETKSELAALQEEFQKLLESASEASCVEKVVNLQL